MKKRVIGIDFGSVYCKTAIYEDGEAKMLKNRFDSETLPYVIEFSQSPSGGAARKSKSPFMINFSSIKQRTVFEFTVSNGEKKFPITDLVTDIFQKVREDVSKSLNHEVHLAVVTVPPFFSERQRATIRTAAENAGFKGVKLLGEANAAVLASEIKEKLILVYALGNGSFNTSLIQVTNGYPSPLCHEGEGRLGGNDFDMSILKFILDRLNISVKDLINHNDSIRKLKSMAKKIKTQLSKRESIDFDINTNDYFPDEIVGKHYNKKLSLSRAEFEKMISKHINKTIELTKKVVKGASRSKDEIDLIMFVGGSTKIPMIERLISKEFNKKIIRAPEDVIAKGAAIYGAEIAYDSLVERSQKAKAVHQKRVVKESKSVKKPSAKKPQTDDNDGWLKLFSSHFISARAEWYNGEQENAVDILETACKELKIFVANLCTKRAETLLETKNYDAALSILEKGLSYDDESSSIKSLYHAVCGHKAYELELNGQYSEAIEYFKTGIKYNPACTACIERLENLEAFVKKKKKPLKKKSFIKSKAKKKRK